MKRTIKNVFVAGFFFALMLFPVLSVQAGGARQGSQKAVRIGWSVQDLSNPIWAAMSEQYQKVCEARGWEFTPVDCAADSGKQITQIENFITSGVNVIILQPADPNSLADVTEKAHAKGIKMIGQGISFPQADVNVVDDNSLAGMMVGETAGKWIVERYGTRDSVEVAYFDWPYIKEAIDRGDGFDKGLAKTVPNARKVANAAAANVTDGMNHAESMLQANPNIKAFLCFGDGPGLGVCEVLESKGVNPNDYGIFAIDATEEAMAKIKSGKTPFRMSVNLGAPDEKVKIMVDVIEKVLAGTAEKWYYNPIYMVDRSNVDQYLK
jgi:ribose transport system substrate-binding protein